MDTYGINHLLKLMVYSIIIIVNSNYIGHRPLEPPITLHRLCVYTIINLAFIPVSWHKVIMAGTGDTMYSVVRIPAATHFMHVAAVYSR